MKLERVRENVFQLTATSQELSALIAAARMARDALLDDQRAPQDALALLERVLAEYDRALGREKT
ncbi:MAG TPA: hypothetical protein VNJ53_01060 [Gaiellaceae bacterium]|nr:hypothetical protein [Gaiellaceae bacterium]